MKKSAHTHWNGYRGGTVGVGGALGCEGAMRLQWLHLFLRLMMSDVMPGQNTDVSALDIIDVTPWCAECRAVSMSLRKEGGTMMRSLYMATPSTVDN